MILYVEMCVELLIVFFNDTATTEIYTLSLHDALPIWVRVSGPSASSATQAERRPYSSQVPSTTSPPGARAERIVSQARAARSEEHTSELQSRQYLVCRLLLEKKIETRQVLTTRTVD